MPGIPTRSPRRSLLATLVVALAVAACSSASAVTPSSQPAATPASAPATAAIGADCDAFMAQKSITAKVETSPGSEIEISLCSNPTTGFSWGDPEISDAAVVSLVDRSFVQPSASPRAMGAAGSESILLKATASGTSTVVFSYARPSGGEAERTYTVMVTVK